MPALISAAGRRKRVQQRPGTFHPRHDQYGLRQITRVSDAKVIGSGRTDAGVHALAQVAHTDLPDQPVARGKDFTEILANGLNGTLPASIRIIAVRRVSPKFHAQHSAKKKQYSYYFQQGSTALPHLSPFSWWIRLPLDQARMNDALKPLIREHDFPGLRSQLGRPYGLFIS